MTRWSAVCAALATSCGVRAAPAPIESSPAFEPAPTAQKVSSSGQSAPAPPSEPAGSTGAPSLAPRRRVPDALLAALLPAPYVEQSCSDAPLAAAPGLLAKRCTYETLGKKATVVVLDPPGHRVARWLVDAATEIPQLVALARADRAAYEEALVSLGLAVVRQSSKIFPVEGDIVEDLGKGPRAFPFDRGVARSCSGGQRGCPCRINSISPATWCSYRASQGDDGAACRRSFEGAEGEARWREHCLATHVASLPSTEHPHFRAMLWWMGGWVDAVCPRRAKEPCLGADVRDALEKAQRAWRTGESRPGSKRPSRSLLARPPNVP